MSDLSKSNLELLYETMSIKEIAEHLGVSKSKIYYHFRKNNIKRRSRKDAFDKKFDVHPRIGTTHSKSSKDKISDSAGKFWDSERGKRAKDKLSEAKKRVWLNMTPSQKKALMDKLNKTPRNKLSSIAKALFDFFKEKKEVVLHSVQLTESRKFDIILEEHKIAIKVIPLNSSNMPAYGGSAPNIPDNICGYVVIPYKTRCGNISKAECNRLYKSVLELSAKKGV